MRTSRIVLASFASAAALALAACGSKDNSADTDKASKDLRAAQSEVAEKRTDLHETGDEIERRKRELLKEQQELADKEAALVAKGQQLGSAEGTLDAAGAAYRAAVMERLAKLDAALASLATKTDAASKDAAAGLKARRDLLGSLLASMPAAADSAWIAYTKDVDTTFDAIERDLRAAAK
ncbi:MAG: hypothetical protein H0T42_32460 [Deltaproteobacteria bacterium]|nr:hypothetical protein [Deltaproteobacteria bacterium]